MEEQLSRENRNMEPGFPQTSNFSEVDASESEGAAKAALQSIESEGLGPCNLQSANNRKLNIHAITATTS